MARVVTAVVLYVGVRVVLVAVLAGIMIAVGIQSLVALMFGIVLALPLSVVLFRPLRNRMNAEIDAAGRDRRARRERLRAELRGDRPSAAGPGTDDAGTG